MKPSTSPLAVALLLASVASSIAQSNFTAKTQIVPPAGKAADIERAVQLGLAMVT